MTRRKALVKIRVAPERLGDLVNDLNQIDPMGEFDEYLVLRVLPSLTCVSRTLTVFLPQDTVDDLAGRTSVEILRARYASAEKSHTK